MIDTIINNFVLAVGVNYLTVFFAFFIILTITFIFAKRFW